MKKLVLVFFLSLPAFAQSICTAQLISASATGTSAVIDNRSKMCSEWVVTYNPAGLTAISLQLETANNNAAGTSPGTFALSTGSVVEGSNPSTAVNCQTTSNCQFIIHDGYAPWVRLNFTSLTGTGTLTALAFGTTASSPVTSISPSGSTACPGTIGTPCLTAGLDSAGAVTPFQICTLSGTFDTSAAGNTLLVAASGTTQIRFCKFNLIDVGTGNTMQLKQGTGATCAGGTSNLWMVYTSVFTVAEDFGSPLIASASNAVCINLANATRVVGGFEYAQR
jgi:hypothetical protein